MDLVNMDLLLDYPGRLPQGDLRAIAIPIGVRKADSHPKAAWALAVHRFQLAPRVGELAAYRFAGPANIDALWGGGNRGLAALSGHHGRPPHRLLPLAPVGKTSPARYLSPKRGEISSTHPLLRTRRGRFGAETQT